MNASKLNLGLLSGLGIVLCFGAFGGEESKPAKPNIVLIMADDMGFSDLGCFGSEIDTPNIDKLAFGGLRFTQFYNTARCCPTRASLLTGLYPHQAGIGDMIKNLGTPPYQGYLNDRCVTIAEVLRQGGYSTLMAGKWHVGENRPHWPTDRGFDHYFGLISGACNYFKLDKDRQMALDDQPYTPPENGFYMTDAFTDHAVGFIKNRTRKDKPFFLYAAYTAPHWPLHAWPEDIAKYKDKYLIGWDTLREQRHKRMIELGIVDAKWPISPRDKAAPAWGQLDDEARQDWAHRMAVYAAQIDHMDQGIGKILQALKEIGAEKNTLIFFLSDNGGCAEWIKRGEPGARIGARDSFDSYGLPWANASNTPLRLYKQRVHEGGIATPLIVYWPGVIKPGGLSDEAGHVIDLMPTCLDVAGLEYPRSFQGRSIVPVQGKSLAPVFNGKKRDGHEVLFWEHEGNRAVRKGKWKLVALRSRPWELFDIQADRTELHNLASEHPDKVRELLDCYETWAARCGVIERK